ncbi:unnamed protein product [Strongylus vulgaris]|uniref:Uncharacterized protein n=1 Tax=Strongylus vulgaris TaxID=40348 RepID=A0A3P7M0P1_STRVU|nr:unnamed protein product [Strongylus vulgaris]
MVLEQRMSSWNTRTSSHQKVSAQAMLLVLLMDIRRQL